MQTEQNVKYVNLGLEKAAAKTNATLLNLQKKDVDAKLKTATSLLKDQD